MSYSVQFVGLACFLRDGKARRVLLPDGRTPPDGIEPHYAFLDVGPNSIRESRGWNGDASAGLFELPPCDITFEGADADGSVDTSGQDGRLPQLKRINPDFQISSDRDATIATVSIRQGTLTAYRIPGGTAVISQLDVPHDGSIRVRITPRDGSPSREIVLEPQTEIVLSNTGRGGYQSLRHTNDHFRIYEKLSATPVRLDEPVEASVAGVPQSPTRHRYFAAVNSLGLSSGCSNTGCCSP